jgi:hypothetical protein
VWLKQNAYFLSACFGTERLTKNKTKQRTEVLKVGKFKSRVLAPGKGLLPTSQHGRGHDGEKEPILLK